MTLHPLHGAERNRRIETTVHTDTGQFTTTTGTAIHLPSSHTVTVSEKYCARCGWVECRGLMGFFSFAVEHAHPPTE